MGTIFSQQFSARIADFFDTPLDSAFGRTADGREVVYPWPWPHRGYILPDSATVQRLRATMQWWVRMALPVFLMLAIFGLRPLLVFGFLYIDAYYINIWTHVNRFASSRNQVEPLESEETSETQIERFESQESRMSA